MKLKLTFQFFLTAKKSLFKREFCKLASKEIIKKMTVNKRILEQKTNQELEDYIKPESKFIDLAKIYAFEILQTRGRLLNDEETKTYNELIANEKNNEIVEIHPNYKKSHTVYQYICINRNWKHYLGLRKLQHNFLHCYCNFYYRFFVFNRIFY